jgi:parvulin-like peptidyl-prolyl isomerase
MTALEVEGVRIGSAEIRAESARLRQQAKESRIEITLDVANDLLAEAGHLLIERVLLDREAARLGIVVDPSEIAAQNSEELRVEIERRMRVDKLVEFWTKDLKPPGTNVIRKIYERERERFQLPEFLFVSQIVKNIWHADERDRARQVLELVEDELERGGDFAELAGAHSDCPESGGALGFITRGEMVREFDEVVFALQPGDRSPIFETRFGWHIAQAGERRPAGVRPLSEAAPMIANALLNEAKERLLAARLDELHSRASVRRVTL